MLTTISCTQCSGHFIVHTMDLHHDFICGMCNTPSRAGKTRKAALALAATRITPALVSDQIAPLPTRRLRPVQYA